MSATPYPEVNALLDDLLVRFHDIFGDELVSVYLHGSLIVGDFDETCSDLDLLVVLARDVDAGLFAKLDAMHKDMLSRYPEWDNRLDIDYVSRSALRQFKTERHPMAVITPGDAFAIIDAGADWLLSWYPILQKSVTLFGPAPDKIIPAITTAEWRKSIRAHVAHYRERVEHGDPNLPQAYLVLLLCRALYSLETGKQTSKVGAGQWALERYTDHAEAITSALKYRRPQDEANADFQARLPETRRFYHFVLAIMQD